MSSVTTALGARVVEPCPLGAGCTATTLADLAPGATATVMDVCAGTDPAVARRLFDLAFAPGAQVQVVRQAPMADPVVFRVAGYDIALRRAQARTIRVFA